MLEPPNDHAFVAIGSARDQPGAALLANGATARQANLPPALAQVTRTGVTQLQALVDRVLEFDLHLSPPADAQHAAATTIELAPLLEEIASWYASIAEAKGVRFAVCVPSGLATWAYAASLRRALIEVMDNAVRYSEGGTITLAATLHDGLAVVSISDEGPGIPPDERDRLFATFYRGSGTRSLSATPGAGLGLSIARRDIQALGGQIWLDRSGPSGSTMCLALPAVLLDAGGRQGEGRARAVGGSDRLISNSIYLLKKDGRLHNRNRPHNVYLAVRQPLHVPSSLGAAGDWGRAAPAPLRRNTRRHKDN